MVKVITDADISKHTSLGIGGRVPFFVEVHSKRDVVRALKEADERGVEPIILGGGTNVVFGDGKLDYFVIKNELRGLDLSGGASGAFVRIGAGEVWDSAVERCVSSGLSGVEALSGIPGRVGAAPIQNIGAYGTELSDVLHSVEVFDRRSDSFITLTNDECSFGYRDSLFKKHPHRFVVIAILLRLQYGDGAVPEYDSVKTYMREHGITNPTAAQVRQMVLSIRGRKLPDPGAKPNAGSFFKNVVVSKRKRDELLQSYPDMPFYEIDDENFKLYSGWILEKLGYRGRRVGNLSFHTANALVLLNNREASFRELSRLIASIKDAASDAFGVALEVEPNIYE